MPLECLPVAMLYVPFHRASAYDCEQTSKSRFSSEDLTQSDRFEGLTEVCPAILIKVPSSSINQREE